MNQDDPEGNDISLSLSSDEQKTSFTENTTEHDMSYIQCKQMKRKVNNF